MFIMGLMDSEPNFRYSNSGSFPGRGAYVFAVQLFEVSNEEAMGG